MNTTAVTKGSPTGKKLSPVKLVKNLFLICAALIGLLFLSIVMLFR